MAFPAISAAFLASLVEAVEAVTIVLAVVTVRGWRSACTGAIAGLVALTLIVLTERAPLRPLQFVIGVLLLLFGMRWLSERTVSSRSMMSRSSSSGSPRCCVNPPIISAARSDHRAREFQAVLLEGLEVMFIVLAIGAGSGLLGGTSLGAMSACGLIIAIGRAARRPLARLPENTLKFAVGTLLSAFADRRSHFQRRACTIGVPQWGVSMTSSAPVHHWTDGLRGIESSTDQQLSSQLCRHPRGSDALACQRRTRLLAGVPNDPTNRPRPIEPGGMAWPRQPPMRQAR